MSRLQNPVVKYNLKLLKTRRHNRTSCESEETCSVILTFFVLPSSASDKAITSPDRNCEAFRVLACTITRRMARMPISLVAGSIRPSVNLDIDVDADIFA
jgi:hypothetical protein